MPSACCFLLKSGIHFNLNSFTFFFKCRAKKKTNMKCFQFILRTTARFQATEDYPGRSTHLLALKQGKTPFASHKLRAKCETIRKQSTVVCQTNTNKKKLKI